MALSIHTPTTPNTKPCQCLQASQWSSRGQRVGLYCSAEEADPRHCCFAVSWLPVFNLRVLHTKSPCWCFSSHILKMLWVCTFSSFILHDSAHFLTSLSHNKTICSDVYPQVLWPGCTGTEPWAMDSCIPRHIEYSNGVTVNSVFVLSLCTFKQRWAQWLIPLWAMVSRHL